MVGYWYMHLTKQDLMTHDMTGKLDDFGSKRNV